MAAKQEPKSRAFLLSHLHRIPLHCFSIFTCTMPVTGAAIFEKVVRNALSTCVPSALKSVQAAQVVLLPSSTEPVGAISFFDCDQASFTVMAAAGGGDAYRQIADVLQKIDLGSTAGKSPGSSCASGGEPNLAKERKSHSQARRKQEGGDRQWR
jgi:hypothetical protein